MAINRTKKVTLSDVAELAGVSRTTASYILGKTRGGFAKETVERVANAAKQLGFKPNPIAQSLRTGRTGLIGVIVVADGKSAHYHSRCQMEVGIATEARKQQMDVVQTVICPEICSEVERVEELLGTGLIEGLILDAPRQRPIIQWLKDYGATFVVVGNPDISKITSVDIDNIGLGRATAQYLIDLGHKNLLHIAPPDDLTHGNDRVQGFMLACDEADIDPEDAIVVRAEDTMRGGHRAMKKALKLGMNVTGVCAHNDSVAYGAIEAIREAGLRVPEDISVVGCNQNDRVGIEQEFLTTVKLDYTELGTLATSKLFALLEGKSTSPRELIGFSLVERRSAGPAPMVMPSLATQINS